MSGLRLAEGDAVIVRHVTGGVFGVKTMAGKYLGRDTTEITGYDGRKERYTVLNVEAVWPYSPKPRIMAFTTDDKLNVGSFREWRLEEAK